MRILHTADWHLGHSLHDVSREREHSAFLAWLLDQLSEHAIDLLLVCGDIFDTANPSAAAQRSWFEFLADARARVPGLDVVAIAGNHDSASRLDAPESLLTRMGVHVVGTLPRRGDRSLDADRLLVRVEGAGGDSALVVALPYLRAADLPRSSTNGDDGDGQERDPLVEGVRQLHEEALAAARTELRSGEALLVTGHAYLQGGTLSELSERKVLGGNLHAIPTDVFPEDVSYVALGHLHRPQSVAGRAEVRYAGSPIPLALDEAGYPHQVRLVELDGPALVRNESLRVPRTVDILQVPSGDPVPLEELLPLLEALPARDLVTDDEQTPYLEVRVSLPKPAAVRREVEAALADRAVRLLKLTVSYTGTGRGLADAAEAVTLSELTAEDVFRRRWERDHGDDLPPDLLEAFHELLEDVQRGDEARGEGSR